MLRVTLLGTVLFLLLAKTLAAPAISPSSTSSTTSKTPARIQPHVAYTDSNPNDELWIAPEWELDSDGSPLTPPPTLKQSLPQPQRDALGATILGPHNVAMELQNADALAPPTTDHGSVKNFKWPYSFSHNRLANGGWARQQNG